MLRVAQLISAVPQAVAIRPLVLTIAGFIPHLPKVGLGAKTGLRIPAQEPTARRPPRAFKLSKFTAHRLKAVVGVVVPIGARLDAVQPSFEISANAGYVVQCISLGTLLALLCRRWSCPATSSLVGCRSARGHKRSAPWEGNSGHPKFIFKRFWQGNRDRGGAGLGWISLPDRLPHLADLSRSATPQKAAPPSP
jgi:hypothetical protein